MDEPGLADIDTESDLCRVAVEEERWVDATNAYRQTQYAVNRRSNYVDFYNILKFRVFSKDNTGNKNKMGGMEGK